MKFKLNKIVEVEWRDACSRGGWGDLKGYNEGPMLCKTSGYLLEHTKAHITIVSTQSIDESANGAISIPAPWVTKFTVLRK